MRGGVLLFVEYNLRQTGAVAQVDKNQIAQVSAFMDPAHQDDVFVGVRWRADCRSSVCVAVFRVNRARIVVPLFVAQTFSLCAFLKQSNP